LSRYLSYKFADVNLLMKSRSSQITLQEFLLPKLIRQIWQRLGLAQAQFDAKLGVSLLSVNR
jgi:DNA-binding transcriptional regulator YiaG